MTFQVYQSVFVDLTDGLPRLPVPAVSLHISFSLSLSHVGAEGLLSSPLPLQSECVKIIVKPRL